MPDLDPAQVVDDLAQAVTNAKDARDHMLGQTFPDSPFIKAPSMGSFDTWPEPTKLAYWAWLRGLDDVALVLAVMDGIPPGTRFNQLSESYRNDLTQRAHALITD
jgi:hypothetical protein